MKRGAIKTSGILTLVFYILAFLVSLLVLGYFLDIPFVTGLYSVDGAVSDVLIKTKDILIGFPVELVLKIIEVDAGLIQKILSVVLTVFCMFMIFWGIKEIQISKREDAAFAKSKKTCGFMMFFKFMIFAVFTAYGVYLFIENGLTVDTYVLGSLALFSFLIFLLPTINLAKGARAFKKSQNDTPVVKPKETEQESVVQQQQAEVPFPTMQANMPPLYNPNARERFDSQINPAPPASQGVVPGQNGVPLNISEKGIADLERLDRLKSSGAITDENYIAMRNKIINTKLS